MNETKVFSRRITLLVLVLILCIAAFLRFTVATRSEFVNPLAADSGRYFSYVYNVQHFGIYSSQVAWDPTHAELPIEPDKVRTPGYPGFLLLLPEAEPTIEWVRQVFLWQALFGVLTVLFAFLLARRALAAGWALSAALLTALSPHLVATTAEVLTECLFALSLTAATWALAMAMQTCRASWVALAGALWGWAALVRPTAEFLPPLAFLACVALPSLRPKKGAAGLVLLVFLVIQAPWWVRNQSIVPRPGTEDLTVNFLHHGSYPDLMYRGRPDTLGFPYRFDPESPRIGASVGSALANIGHQWREHPAESLRWYLVGKPISYLSWKIIGGWGDIFTSEPTSSPFLENRMFSSVHAVMRALHALLMWLGVIGGVLAWVRPSILALNPFALIAARVAAGVMAYAIALHIVGAPFPRYSIPFRPIMYMLAMLPMAAVAVRLALTWKRLPGRA